MSQSYFGKSLNCNKKRILIPSDTPSLRSSSKA
eukprot:UN15650